MSNFSSSHGYGSYEERRGKRKGGILVKWQKIDDIVSEVYVDLCNGLTKSDVLKKLQAGMYKNQEGKPLCQRSSYDYVKNAYMRMQYDFQQQVDELRADLYAKMMAVYSDCMKKGDRYNALIALDKIMKLTGCAAKEAPQTAIQINNNSDGITINFGFGKDEKEDDEKVGKIEDAEIIDG